MSLLYSNSLSYQDEGFLKSPTCFSETPIAGEFELFRSLSLETDALVARYLGHSGDVMLQQNGDTLEIKQEMEYQSQPLNNEMESFGNSVSSFAKVNGSNLLRHNSSPPGLFSNQGLPNGFNEVASESSRKSNNPLNMHQFDDFGHKNAALTGPEPDINAKRKYMNFDSRMDSSSSQFKRLRNHDDISFSTSNILENQDGNRRIGLTHHHSLPTTAAEMAKIEKLMKFEGSPCKIRAKRGFATHPRSIAERVRRTRISERMRKLQDLFPNLDKQTNTADMLDMAVDYIKELEKQVKSLSETKSKCKCSTPHLSNSDSCF